LEVIQQHNQLAINTEEAQQTMASALNQKGANEQFSFLLKKHY